MKRALLGTTAIVGASLVAALPASAKPTVTIGGAMDFQVGWTSQDREGWTPTPGGVQGPATERGFSVFHKTYIYFRASDTTDSGMKWLFKVDLNADADGGPNATFGTSKTGRDNANHATLTLSDAWGSVEVGADHPAYFHEAIGAGDAVGKAGTGGVDGDWPRWVNNESVTDRFETGVILHNATTASHISYKTPRAYGFRAAATYTPDHRTIGRFRQVANPGKANEIDFIDGGVDYAGKFGEVDFAASAVIETNSNSFAPMRNGLTYQVGALAGYQHWKLAAGYGDKVRDGETMSTDTNTAFNLWDVGVGYTTGPWALGLSYMRQNAGHIDSTGTDSQNLYAFSTTYDMGGGLQLYSELFHMENKGGSPTASSASNNTATGLISGVRVKF